MSLLESLVVVSEKAANIARICRKEKHLFELLVQEKGDAESNPRFVQDFKTLADVLIQETVKHDVGNQFPELKDHIKGEENNIFCNKLGETVRVEIRKTSSETAELLSKVLNDDERAANVLAEEVHREVALNDVNCCKSVELEPSDVDYSKLGVWIDPIDSTAEYISGRDVEVENGIFVSGLRCVTVLIGVFDRDTGIPLIGVVNQPFHEEESESWRGVCHWGFSAPSTGLKSSCSCSIPRTPSNIVCLSSSEDVEIKNRLSAKGFTLVEAAGAGYKILTVITGLADAYVLSKDTTFKWDTCGPQAILRSLGGDVLKFDDALTNAWRSLEYKCNGNEGPENESKIVECCNAGGIIAYRDERVCKDILDVLNLSMT